MTNKKTKPFFSIIIPTYNRAHTIRRPIDSILAQTFTHWELIIVDDGSTDETREIIESYNDQRIRYVWQENQKESAARNHGIKLSNGKYICFQDSDDEYLPNHLAIHFKAINQIPEFKVFRSGLLIYQNDQFLKKAIMKNGDKYDQFPFDSFQAHSFAKEVLDQIQFEPKIYIAEDLHFLIRIRQKFEIKIIYEYTGIYHYDPKSSGGVGPKYESNLTNKLYCLNDILSLNNHFIIPYLKRSICLAHLLLFTGHIRNHQKMKALSSISHNFQTFCRFPQIYTMLLSRVIIVKFGEMTGWFQFSKRF